MSQPPPDLAPTLVIGHKNPDTDAICSAIGYADFLKQSRGERYTAGACGVMNARTAWVLEKANIPTPIRVMDVRPTAGDLCRRDVLKAEADDTFLEVYQRISEKGFRSLPVVDHHNHPLGMVSLLSLLRLVIPDHMEKDATAVRKVTASIDNIAKVLGATVDIEINEADKEEEFLLTVAGTSADAFARRTSEFAPENTLIIAGDRPQIHLTAIERGTRLLVLTAGFHLEDETLITMAKKRGTCVISSPHDTGSTLQLIRCARKVVSAVDENGISFKDTDTINFVRSSLTNTNQTLFHVTDTEDGTLVGVLSKSDLVNPPLRRLILVDHNEFSQAVDGADQANILEVLDHHRLSGNLITKEPVRFINDPVGSTCTIVARHFENSGLKPEPAIATCLMAGIISDTLNLSSPTTTPIDVKFLQWLSEIAGLDSDTFAKEFFEVGSVLRESSPKDAIHADRKEYTENGWKISISQIEELGLDIFEQHKAKLQDELENLVTEMNYDFVCLLVTDITLNNSMLLTAGSEDIINEIDYPMLDSNQFHLRGVVSRKKQLFPFLSRIFSKTSPPKE